MGFNDPLHVQYARFMGDALRGDFGTSLRFHLPAMTLVLQRLPISLTLIGTALVTSLLVAIPAGVVAAVRRGSAFDRALVAFCSFGQAVPAFWLGLMLMVVFSLKLRWLPTGGVGSWAHLVLPTVTLALYLVGRLTRVVRTAMLEVLYADHVRTARAKGLAEVVVLGRHALRNASVTLVTMVGLQLGQLLGGAVVVESVFSWAGIGWLLVQSLLNRDFPVALAAVLIIAVLVNLLNLLVDLSYALLDPRVRLS